jgi:glutamate dehydrogenase
VVEALRRAPDVARALIALFDAATIPAASEPRDEAVAAPSAIAKGLAKVAAIDDDRILRLIRGVIVAILRTNAFAPPARRRSPSSSIQPQGAGPAGAAAVARDLGLQPAVEGIHLRGGPIARGGLRWSDRRDDFRTEMLGLMKAQLVKNAVIVPTGAKGGFYPKQLPPVSNRDAWLAEGTESYKIFIRALLSVTDNLVEGKVVHPDGVVIHDGDDPYFVVAADKGTATFSDIANAIAIERGFWLGDAFASRRLGTATTTRRWASPPRAPGSRSSATSASWASTSRPSRSPSPAVGDMSGDVFGNGMLLSKALKLVAAFDHRHIFLDPDPDPAKSWAERKRMFDLPRSSWDDYDKKLISKGGGVFPRSQKSIPLARDPRDARPRGRGARAGRADQRAILKAPVDLLWFGGIGTYIKAKGARANAEVGDPGQRRDPRQRRRASRQGDRRGRQPRHHPGRPDRVRQPAGGSTPTSSTIRPASTARTTRSTSRSRSTAR